MLGDLRQGYMNHSGIPLDQRARPELKVLYPGREVAVLD